MEKLQNKIDFTLIFEVKNANPNGDPLNGNRPRTNVEDLGEVSDVCLKRKIRNRLQQMQEKILRKVEMFLYNLRMIQMIIAGHYLKDFQIF